MRNDESTIEGKRRIQLLVTNCGTMQMLKWILVEVKHLNWLLKKSNELILRLKTMNLKQPLNTLTRTTRFGYVPNGRKKKSQDYKCRDVNNEWWGYYNWLQYYNIYGTMMKMYLKMLMSNLQWKQWIGMGDVHKEIHQAINLTTWFSNGENAWN
jgi:hypothetical protein